MRTTAVALVLAAISCAHPSPKPNDPLDLAEEKDTVEPRVCTPATTETAPTDGRIATFTAPGKALAFKGRIIPYPEGDALAPKVDTKDGSLHLTVNAPVGEKPQYLGVSLSFPKCVDASAYTGVRFVIHGSYTGCSMQYATGDVGHGDRYTQAPFAAGGRGSYPPQTMFESGLVTPAAQTISIPFTDRTIPGDPPVPLDKTKLTQVLWQLTVSPAGSILDGTTRCVADLHLDEVVFY